MKYKVKVTVIDKKLYPELQKQNCADPEAGMCPCYNVGDEFVFERDDRNDHFWHGGLNKNFRRPRNGGGRSEDAALFRGVGRHLPLHLYRFAGRLHHARLDERGKHHDRLLFRRDKTGDFQDRTDQRPGYSGTGKMTLSAFSCSAEKNKILTRRAKTF